MGRRVEGMPQWRKALVRTFRRSSLLSRVLAPLALTSTYGFASEVGWFRSATARQPVDAEGNPIPWMTYGAIRFLDQRIRSDFRVFEYGMGNSTLWWARRVQRVVSCESEAAWFDRMHPDLPSNVLPLLETDVNSGAYARAILDADGKPFTIVVIDGRDRVRCSRYAVQQLAPDGVILWDNTDRERYRDGLRALHDRGFRQIDFYGLGPVNASPEQSSLLYRPDNCLGI